MTLQRGSRLGSEARANLQHELPRIDEVRFFALPYARSYHTSALNCHGILLAASSEEFEYFEQQALRLTRRGISPAADNTTN